jgi:FkbM family methyltransferase
MDLIEIKRFGVSFNVVDTPLNAVFWKDNYLKWWEQSTFDFIIPLLDKNKTFIDIGSWIGPISLAASKFSKQCVCFEPDPIAYKEFADNIRINNIDNITLENIAISIHPEISIGAAKLGESITRDSSAENAIPVSCITPADIFSKHNIDPVDVSVIKIDIEGHEQQILKDHSILWDLNVPMHISLHPGWKTDKEQYFKDIVPFFNHKNINTTNISNRGDFFDISIK